MPDAFERKMDELMIPINQQIMMCDDSREIVWFACAMLTSAKTIFDNELGVNERIEIMKKYTKQFPFGIPPRRRK